MSLFLSFVRFVIVLQMNLKYLVYISLFFLCLKFSLSHTNFLLLLPMTGGLSHTEKAVTLY